MQDLTEKELAILALTENDRYVLIVLTDIDNKTQKIKIHTHHGDEGEIICEEALRIMKTNADN